MDTLVGFLVLPAVVISFFAALFGVAKVFPPERRQHFGRGLRALQFRLWHVVITVLVTALVLRAFGPGPFSDRMAAMAALSVLVLAWFVRAWCNQFVYLMGLRDDDFPGRHDKLIWVLLLFVFPPITVWFFRTYRLAHWPEPADSPQAGPTTEIPPGAVAQPT
jgi:hypothetical protein